MKILICEKRRRIYSGTRKVYFDYLEKFILFLIYQKVCWVILMNLFEWHQKLIVTISMKIFIEI